MVPEMDLECHDCLPALELQQEARNTLLSTQRPPGMGRDERAAMEEAAPRVYFGSAAHECTTLGA